MEGRARGGVRQRALRVTPRPGQLLRPLYGDGPAYCSGNRTVFVGTAAANRLMAKFGPQAEAGITFLIGHEIGHHIQNLNGRFHALEPGDLLRRPTTAPDYVRRFECRPTASPAWIHDSSAWATSDQFRADLLAVLSDIGDDKLLAGQPEGSFAASDCTGRPSSAPRLVPARRAERRRRGMRHVGVSQP